MFAKKTYRRTRWMEKFIEEICESKRARRGGGEPRFAAPGIGFVSGSKWKPIKEEYVVMVVCSNGLGHWTDLQAHVATFDEETEILLLIVIDSQGHLSHLEWVGPHDQSRIKIKHKYVA